MARGILIGAGVALAASGVVAARRMRRDRAAYAAAARDARAPLAAGSEAREIVRFATLAPNGHNTQPWRFRAAADRIEILPDATRRTPVVDPDDHHLYVSLGAAAETAALAAAALGRPAEVVFDPADGGRLVCALGSGAASRPGLFEAIPARRSTRGLYDGRPLAPEDLALMEAAGTAPGVSVAMIVDPAARDRIGAIVRVASDRQVADPAFVAELVRWLRFNAAEAVATRDGLFAGATGAPSLPGWMGPAVFGKVFTARAEGRRIARQVASSAGLAAFFAERDDPEAWTRVGRAFQRFALQATALGVRTAHLNQPVEVAALRPALAAEAGAPGTRPHLLIRFGRGPQGPASLRRPPEAVLEAADA